MAMKRLIVVLCFGVAGAVHAGTSEAEGAGSEHSGPIPAPPGPYQSSQPYLYPKGSEVEGELPYFGAMAFPSMQHQRPYAGPGRYWAAEPGSSERQEFATVPTPPWGPERAPTNDPQADDARVPRYWGAPGWGQGPAVRWNPWSSRAPQSSPDNAGQ